MWVCVAVHFILLERNERAVHAVQCAVRTVWCELFYEHTIFSFSHSGL